MQDGGVIGYRKRPKTYKNGKVICKKSMKQFSVECFTTFIRNSHVSFMGKGSYGKAYRVTIRDPALSPYIDIEGHPVHVLIVKVGLISNERKPDFSDVNDIQPVSANHFHLEVKMQEEIFHESLNQFDSALCPAIVFLDIVDSARAQHLYPLIFSHHNGMKPESENRFCFIGMETYQNVENAFKYRGNVLDGSKYLLFLRLGALGFAHGDPSLPNIIVDEQNERPYLIDFGHVQKLTPGEKSFMQTQVARISDFKRVQDIVTKGYPVEYAGTKYDSNYHWLTSMTERDVEPVTAETIDRLQDKNWRSILLPRTARR